MEYDQERIDALNAHLKQCIESCDPSEMDSCDWGHQVGVIITGNDAKRFLYLENQNKELKDALMDVVDATEDKGGQFRAWHNHLRDTTKKAKQILNS